MSSEQSSDVKFEIGHVLFIDIVGYSIYAACGEKDAALEQMERTARLPVGITYGELKCNPEWDPLRGDPRFEQIVNSLAPKE
jgi:hypothetical protein